MDVKADNRTAGGSGDPQGWASSSTGDIQQALPGRKVEPLQKLVLLVRGEPTVLSNILAKSCMTDLCVYVGLKISLIGVVVTERRQRVGFAHQDRPNREALVSAISKAWRIVRSLRAA